MILAFKQRKYKRIEADAVKVRHIYWGPAARTVQPQRYREIMPCGALRYPEQARP